MAADTGRMDANTPHTTIDDLYTLQLVDGLATMSEGKTLRYMVVKLRETGVADERAATRLAERVVMVGGVPKLLVSEADFRFALTLRHIEAFVCDGTRIPQALIDMDLLGKLSSHDLGLIEKRVFLITLAAEVRYGLLSPAEFDLILAGGGKAEVAPPQPVGQAAELGANAAALESGPAMLADFTGNPAQGASQGVLG